MIIFISIVVTGVQPENSSGKNPIWVKVKRSGLAVFPLTLTGHNFFIKNNFLVLFEDLKRA